MQKIRAAPCDHELLSTRTNLFKDNGRLWDMALVPSTISAPPFASPERRKSKIGKQEQPRNETKKKESDEQSSSTLPAIGGRRTEIRTCSGGCRRVVPCQGEGVNEPPGVLPSFLPSFPSPLILPSPHRVTTLFGPQEAPRQEARGFLVAVRPTAMP